MERTLESKTRSLEEEKTRAGELEEQLRRLSREMEYARCCAVLKEAQKWEAREARLVRQLEESERRLLIDRAHATRQPTLLATEPLLHDVSGDASALSVTSPPRRNAVTSAPPFVPATQLHATGVRDVPNPTIGVSDVLNPTWSTTGVRDVPNPTTGVSDVLNPTWSTTGVRDVPNPTTGVSDVLNPTWSTTGGRDVLNPTWSTTGVRPPAATTGAGVRLPLSSTSTTVAPGSTWTGMSRRPDEALYSSRMPDVSGLSEVVPSPNVGLPVALTRSRSGADLQMPTTTVSRPLPDPRMPATTAVDFGSRPLPDPRMPATTAVGSRPLPDPRMPATTAVDFGSRPLPDPRMPATTAVGSRPLPDPRMPATTAVDFGSRPLPDPRMPATTAVGSRPLPDPRMPATTAVDVG